MIKTTCHISSDFVLINAKKDGQTIAVTEWLMFDTSLDFVSMLIQEEKALIENDTLKIENAFIPNLTSYQVEKLSLPQPIPYSFSCKSTGTILKNDYRIIAAFKTSSGRPLGKFEVNGPFVEISGNTFTIPNPIYDSLLAIEKINSTNDSSEKLIQIGHLKEILPFESFRDDQTLIGTEILIANKFTFDIVDDENFLFSPCFVDLDEDQMIDLLDEHQQKRYAEQFLGYNEVKTKAQVGLNQFIVIPEKTEKLLKIVKSTLSKNITERRSLFLNPKSYFEGVLADEYDDEYDDIFLSTEQYISNRISHIGVWEPKTQVFLPKPGNEWFPKDCVGITLDQQFLFVKPDNIDGVITKIEKAIEKGDKQVNVEGQSINATPENLTAIKAIKGGIEKEASIRLGHDAPSSEKEKATKVVAIIKDNIDGDIYQSESDKRNVQEIFIPDRLKTKGLYSHQNEGLLWLQNSWNASKRGVLLADDMGLGKTLQALTFLAWLKELEDKQKIEKLPMLIVGPTGLLKNWQDEHNNHLSNPGLGDMTEGFGSSFNKLRRKGLKYAVDSLNNSDWVLTTYDSLALYENIFRRVLWQVIVFDECQAIKNPSSFRTDMAKAMASNFSIGITGTPVENRLSDLWCISDTLSPGFLSTYKDFKENYEKQPENLEELTVKMKEENPPPFMLRRMKENHLTGLPSKNEIVVKEQMPPSQCSIYETILQNVKSEKYRHMPMVAIQHLKAASLIPNFDDALSDDEFISSSGRLIGLFKILDEISAKKEKTLIFLESRKLQEKLIPLIQRRYGLSSPPLLINGAVNGTTRKDRVDIFQSLPEGFNVMIVSPKAGGTGLTLTKANNVIHLERWWNPAVEDQCSDRVYRIGQDKDVNIYIPMAIHPQESINSFDIILNELLSQKRILSRQVIVPTAFTSADHRRMFEQATGKDYEAKEDSFYKSKAWLDLRYRVLNKYGHRCQLCGANNSQSSLHVDHIKPRSKYPHLELEFDNLQVLCEKCNFGKSNKYEDDFR